MKSVFTLFFAALLTFAATAQGLTISTGSIVIDAEGGVELGDVILSNASSSTTEIAIRLERVCLASQDLTAIGICLHFGCLSPVNETTTWGDVSATPYIELESGEDYESFSLHALPIGDHESEWNVVFFDRNNPTTSATLNVSIKDATLEACTLTGTNDFDYSIGKAYPNPAFDIINISYDIDVNEASLNIYNSTGMLIETVVVNPQAERVSVNVADYVSGVYFYNVTDGKGQSKMMSFVK